MTPIYPGNQKCVCLASLQYLFHCGGHGARLPALSQVSSYKRSGWWERSWWQGRSHMGASFMWGCCLCVGGSLGGCVESCGLRYLLLLGIKPFSVRFRSSRPASGPICHLECIYHGRPPPLVKARLCGVSFSHSKWLLIKNESPLPQASMSLYTERQKHRFMQCSACAGVFPGRRLSVLWALITCFTFHAFSELSTQAPW